VATHLVTGVAGQDGVLLARLLLRRGDRVVGTVLPGGDEPLLGYLDGVEVVPLDVRDADGFARLLDAVQPDAVHHLAALSSVAASWDSPGDVEAVNGTTVVDLLEVLLGRARPPVFVQASTSEVFGAAPDPRVDEHTPLAPLSPYAEAKALAHRAVQHARSQVLRATNLVLFGHTSVLQPATFVLPTIADQAAEIAAGKRDEISLRDPRVRRDWGSAADFARAFALAADADPGDYVIGTGVLHSLHEVAGWALAAAGVRADVVATADGPARRLDFDGLCADGSAAEQALGWTPAIELRSEIEHMVRVARRRVETGTEHDPAYLDEVAG